MSGIMACGAASPPNPAASPASSPTVAQSGSLVAGSVVNVVDGDTIDVLIDGVEYRVRYIGIDRPETVHPTRGEEPYGKEHRPATRSWL